MSLFQKRTRPLNRSEAWGCLMANLFVCPGVGTLVAGQKRGLAQIVGAGIGVALSLGGCIQYLGTLTKITPDPGEVRRSITLGLTGIFLFVCFWAWGLFTGVRLLRSTQL